MNDRAPVGALDGIVVVELSLDVFHEVEVVVACIRSGAAALREAYVPGTAAAEIVSRMRTIEQAEAVADEIEAEARRVHDARQAEYRARGKVKR